MPSRRDGDAPRARLYLLSTPIYLSLPLSSPCGYGTSTSTPSALTSCCLHQYRDTGGYPSKIDIGLWLAPSALALWEYHSPKDFCFPPRQPASSLLAHPPAPPAYSDLRSAYHRCRRLSTPLPEIAPALGHYPGDRGRHATVEQYAEIQLMMTAEASQSV